METINESNDDNDKVIVVVPLPSKFLPDQLTTPFLYGLQVDRPLYKLLIEEAIDMAGTATGDEWFQPLMVVSPAIAFLLVSFSLGELGDGLNIFQGIYLVGIGWNEGAVGTALSIVRRGWSV